jgi:hypothetical protein
MGEMYRTFDSQMNREVAIKVLPAPATPIIFRGGLSDSNID